MNDPICPFCGGEESSYQFTAGGLGAEVRECYECESRFWWDGEKSRKPSKVGPSSTEVDR